MEEKEHRALEVGVEQGSEGDQLLQNPTGWSKGNPRVTITTGWWQGE